MTERALPDGGTDWVRVVRARTHNLRDVTVDIPRGGIVAFTGVSGSGKTSLAIDTVHAEAQLRYLEGLSPFVRQYITPKDRPQVDRIEGLGATLAVDQRRLNRHSRSTVATMTGVDAYLGLLYSRLGADGGGEGAGPALSSGHFSRYSPEGGCPRCHGAGGTPHADPDLVVTRPELPLMEGGSPWFEKLRSPEQVAVPFLAEQYGADLALPWRELPVAFRDALLYGTGDVPVSTSVRVPNKNSDAEVVYQLNQPLRGAVAEVERLFAAAGSENAKQRYVPYMRQVPCEDCGGTGYGEAARGVSLAGATYPELSVLRVHQVQQWTARLAGGLTGVRKEIGEALLPEVTGRLRMLERLGLAHLELGRTAPTLSGGELQRARTAAQLSTSLTGIMFVLDELGSGLHPADKERLRLILADLRDAGNTVLLVEHDPDVIAEADWVIDLGPGAGREGGEVMFSGPVRELAACPGSVTGRYLDPSRPRITREVSARAGRHGWMELKDIRVHSVRVDGLRLPLNALTCFTGVSGSGKSSLLGHAVAPALAAAVAGGSHPTVGAVSGIGSVAWVDSVDQSPIGRTPRSNPATYSKAFDAIRKLYAGTDRARTLNLGASAFSFNAAAGRCEACTGYGRKLVDMHFLPDIWATCDVCDGRRFTPDVLSVQYRGLAIDQVLHLTVDEAAEHFDEPRPLAAVLGALRQVGLGYLQLGQSATDLSGGEAQRLKLADAIRRGATGGRGGVVLLDEPLTGLHPADVQRMAGAFDALLAAGHTVLVAEHDLHLANCADWLVDMGPGAGEHGGRVVAEGIPEEVRATDTATAGHLRRLVRPAR
ncbi:excinuclease ABC subunit UvrA [Streptomyces sp. TBY4]|uniref:excinuclease ABC subunit UvrA n=1 Tax=Streptomyces sp. TBY4 TaxID=2962030 RepID=UPI0020B8E2B8|nr:excinuclease ABC subunit UvrA [Streptomyces sp. TBY4]MCP3759155.1 excinuclease ABC subunit UvrA [Streptomyces sp. TBY4]